MMVVESNAVDGIVLGCALKELLRGAAACMGAIGNVLKQNLIFPPPASYAEAPEEKKKQGDAAFLSARAWCRLGVVSAGR